MNIEEIWNLGIAVQILTVVGIILGIVTAVLSIWKFRYTHTDRQPKLGIFERFKENGNWKIRVHSPTKIIEKCNIEFNGKKLILSDEKNYNRSIGLGDGDNFNMPKNVSDDDDHFVIVKEGKKTILKEKFKDMYTNS